MTVEGDIQKLEGEALVELFQLDATGIGGDIALFHRYLQQGSIWFNGDEYHPMPIEAEGFSKTSEQPPTPRLTVANLNGAISELCRLYDDLLGAKLTRLRTFGKYLDPDSFLGPNKIKNGVFDTNLEYWHTTPTWTTWYAGTMRIVGDGASNTGTAEYEITNLTIGQNYRIEFEVLDNDVAFAVGSLQYGNDIVASSPKAPGLHIVNFTATTTTVWLNYARNATTATRLDNFWFRHNPGNPTADGTQMFPPEVWYIERKASESNEAVAFELVSAMDLNGVKLPNRQIIANFCSWLAKGGYRGPNCGYTGPPVAKADNTPTSDPDEDKCGGRLSSCQLREWPDGILNFGGFPAAGLVRT